GAPGMGRGRAGWRGAGAAAVARGGAQGPAAGLRGGPGRASQDPGPVAAGQAVPQQCPQVDRGAPVVQPGVVLGGADVAQPDPPPVAGRSPGAAPLVPRPV